MTDPVDLSRRDAAARCGVHVDTIRRHEKNFPNKVQRDGKWMIPVSDLVAAGLLDPFANNEHVEEIAARSRAERDLIALRQEHAVLKARFDAERTRAERAEADVAYFKKLVSATAVA
jgi:hypothetical protein